MLRLLPQFAIMASPFLSRVILSNPTNATISSSSASISPSFPLHHSTFLEKYRRRWILTVQSKIHEIFMPALSSTMTEGTIVSWIKSEGDKLKKGESVVVVESDKADMDVETFYNGILAAIVVSEGESAPVGAAIGILAENKEELDEAKAQAASISTTASVSSSPSTQAAVTPTPPAATSTPSPAIEQPPPAPTAAPSGPKKIVATPFAKKLAKQHKLDINSVVGTVPYGRTTPAEVESAAGIASSKKSAGHAAAAAESVVIPPKAATPSALPPPLPGSTVVPFTTMQAAISKNILESLSVPTFRVGYPVSTNALDALYEKVY